MRLRRYSQVLVSGVGIPFSLVPHEFNGEICMVDWVNHKDEDDQWVNVRIVEPSIHGGPSYGSPHRVHSCQCMPLPKGYKPA